jgi:hypothetical protein
MGLLAHDFCEPILDSEIGQHLGRAVRPLIDQNHHSPVKRLRVQSLGHEHHRLVAKREQS